MLPDGSVQVAPLLVANRTVNASAVATRPTALAHLQTPQSGHMACAADAPTCAQVMLPDGSVQVAPLLVANRTVNASAATGVQRTDYQTTLVPGISSNWSTQAGVDACLHSWVMGQIPVLAGNGSDISGCAAALLMEPADMARAAWTPACTAGPRAEACTDC